MSYTITDQCIRCDRCLSVCPTGAVNQIGNRYWIEPNLCNDCAGHYSVPQCAAVCPTNAGCVAELKDYWDWWFQAYNRHLAQLEHPTESLYWLNWFDRYARRVQSQIQAQQIPAQHSPA